MKAKILGIEFEFHKKIERPKWNKVDTQSKHNQRILLPLSHYAQLSSRSLLSHGHLRNNRHVKQLTTTP